MRNGFESKYIKASSFSDAAPNKAEHEIHGKFWDIDLATIYELCAAKWIELFNKWKIVIH